MNASGDDALLRARAERLARPHETPVASAEEGRILVLALGPERYGLDAAQIVDVFTPREITPVPCTPPFVLGVVNHRGRILTVLDLPRLFDLADTPPEELRTVVAVEAAGLTLGIAGTAVTGPVVLGAALAPPPGSLPPDRRGLLRGVTADLVPVLDLDALAGDPRLRVNDEGD